MRSNLFSRGPFLCFFGWVASVGFLVATAACAGGDPAPPPASSLAALSPAAKAALLKHAVVVGIDDYRSAARRAGASAEGRTLRNLEGAVRDAEVMYDLLVTRFDFPVAGVQKLTDRQASRAAIVAALEALILAADAGDEAVFFFAGHGSQVAGSRPEEPDLQGETLVPWDAGAGVPDLQDKELRRLFNRLLDRGVRLTVLLDACHSGSAMRGLPLEGSARALEPVKQVPFAGDPGPQLHERGALVLAASQADQLALEAPDDTGEMRGAFSLALGRALVHHGDESAETIHQVVLAQVGGRQRPVLDAGTERRQQALFEPNAKATGSRARVAVEGVDPEGKVVLQGGWATGLVEGMELEVTDQEGRSVRLRVLPGVGPSRAEAVVVPGAPEKKEGGAEERLSDRKRAEGVPAIAAGALAERVAWRVQDRPGLVVWIPGSPFSWDELARFAQAVEKEGKRLGWQWVADPTEVTPTHVLRWERGSWTWVSQRTRTVEALGPAADVARVAQRLGSGEPGRLFVHLPVPEEFAQLFELGAGRPLDAIERREGPAGVDYQLVTRFDANRLELAWVAPGRDAAGGTLAGLPARTRWDSDTAGLGTTFTPEKLVWRLEDRALALGRIRLWLELEPPSKERFGYQLGFRREGETSPQQSRVLREGERYALALVAKERITAKVSPRYVYVFALASDGSSTLLYPLDGVVENRYPLPSADAASPQEIPIGNTAAFRVRKPLGLDTYFLLTTTTPLYDPWVLDRPGVRSPPRAATNPLEQLLAGWGSAQRGVERLVPVDWTLERVQLESRPAEEAP